MRIISKQDAITVVKPEGLEAGYYLFDEYEIITNIQLPNTTQEWHHHEKIWETTLMIEGEMTVEWTEASEKKSQFLHTGDLVESEFTPHTYVNYSAHPAKFITIKQVLSGKNHRSTFKSDKILDTPV